MDKNIARRSAEDRAYQALVAGEAIQLHDIPCLFLWTFMAISLRRSVSFLPPKAAFLSLEAFSNCSNLVRSMPLPRTGASAGRRGESCFGTRGDVVGGGDSSMGRKVSMSRPSGVDGMLKPLAEKGEKGSGTGSSGGASEMEISGTGERATMVVWQAENSVGRKECGEWNTEDSEVTSTRVDAD